MDADRTRGDALPAQRPFAVCLYGPTGAGKTDIALRLADLTPLEIISVDSAMIYRLMDIGTAKPAAAERAAVPHHLIDIRNPWESYSAGEFRADALRLIPEICGRGRLPLLVGGTMLYFRALWRGLAPLPKADRAVRAELARAAGQHGWKALHEELARVDPAAAGRITPSDRQRIERALEVFRLTGRPISRLQAERDAAPRVRLLRIALWPSDRAQLYRVLEERLRAMLRAGFVEEVRRLRALPQMSADCPAMRAVGYRQLWQHLAGQFDFTEAERRAAVATRRLAKRQLTWMRADPADIDVPVPAEDAAARIAGVLVRAGVSRQTLRCNMMGMP